MIDEIKRKFAVGEFEYSKHALDQSVRRTIPVSDLLQAVGRCEVIEDNPADKYGPSCLLLGYTDAGRALHVLCSYPSRPLLKVVTLYEPDSALWIDDRTRRT